jgi:hypothetical protein
MKEAARRLFAKTLTIPQIKSELEVLYEEVPKCVVINRWMHDCAVPLAEREIKEYLDSKAEEDAFAAVLSWLAIHNYDLRIIVSPKRWRPRPVPTETLHEEVCYQCDGHDFRVRHMEHFEDIEGIRRATGTGADRYYMAYCTRCGSQHNWYLITTPAVRGRRGDVEHVIPK